MNKLEQIFLELAVEHFVPVSDALYKVEKDWPPMFTVLFNREPLGITRAQCADLLWELNKQQLIAFQYRKAGPYSLHAPAVDLDYNGLLDALRKKHEARRVGSALLSYHLTPAGGAVWESAAQADWSRFLASLEAYGRDWQEVYDIGSDEDLNFDWSVSDDSERNDRLQVCLTAGSLNLAEERYDLDARLLGVVAQKSRRDQKLMPWKATYWKTLPAGFRIGYSIYGQEELQKLPVPVDPEILEDKRRYTPDWYQKAS